MTTPDDAFRLHLDGQTPAPGPSQGMDTPDLLAAWCEEKAADERSVDARWLAAEHDGSRVASFVLAQRRGVVERWDAIAFALRENAALRRVCAEAREERERTRTDQRTAFAAGLSTEWYGCSPDAAWTVWQASLTGGAPPSLDTEGLVLVKWSIVRGPLPGFDELVSLDVREHETVGQLCARLGLDEGESIAIRWPTVAEDARRLAQAVTEAK